MLIRCAGSIIGKSGQKINEIRQMSACQIKICEPGEGSPGASANERVRPLLCYLAVDFADLQRLSSSRLRDNRKEFRLQSRYCTNDSNRRSRSVSHRSYILRGNAR